jgi:protein-tyrosine phosphatase
MLREPMYGFAPATDRESIVFGAARPGYKDRQVREWIEFMLDRQIQQVCCLLTESQLRRYNDLLTAYRSTFGGDRVCWAPINDFDLVKPEILIHQILPFLIAADRDKCKVVVHCSGGVGRTGHVLAAWSIAGRKFSPTAAITAVKQMGRNPHEAIFTAPLKGRNPWRVAAELNALLDECDRLF